MKPGLRSVACSPRMRRANRLRASEDFARVRRHGRRHVNHWLVLVVGSGGGAESRVGLAIGRKLGSAVERNKIKRRLRERLRHHLSTGRLRDGVDLVLIARQPAREADFPTLVGALDDLLARAGLIDKEPVP